jgi:hypothetical protein
MAATLKHPQPISRNFVFPLILLECKRKGILFQIEFLGFFRIRYILSERMVGGRLGNKQSQDQQMDEGQKNQKREKNPPATRHNQSTMVYNNHESFALIKLLKISGKKRINVLAKYAIEINKIVIKSIGNIHEKYKIMTG